jgi:hypothetical protein
VMVGGSAACAAARAVPVWLTTNARPAAAARPAVARRREERVIGTDDPLPVK